MAKLSEGDKAPSFELQGTGGKLYSLADYLGDSGVILAFYPGDFTPGCTKQFCSYRDDGDRIESLGVPVLGISPQDVDSHERFVDEARTERAAPRRRGQERCQGLRRSRPRRLRAAIGLPGRRRGNHPLQARRPDRHRLSGRRRPRARGPGSSLTGSEPTPFELDAGGLALRGEEVGEGPAIVALHGITATRRYVFHGSKALPRDGYRVLSYDARGHGESDGAPDGGGYGYPELAADLGAVLAAQVDGTPVAVGHSMGCHTAAAYALAHGDQLAGLVLIGPAALGLPPDPETLAHWDGLAAGLDEGGVEGFMAAYEADLAVSPEWRETAIRITRERMSLHTHPDALAVALRETPRSMPIDGLAELSSLGLPALVVASRDEADPTHPLELAQAWADALPRAQLIVEGDAESPLAWQGGRLSREVAAFCERPEVAERHR